MNDERLIEYFIQQTNERLERIELKMDKVLQFKWQVLGVATAVSAIIGFVVQAYLKL